jgi:predicted CoA-binding protein
MLDEFVAFFFIADKVLFFGYSKKHEAFCKAVKAAFEESGARVFPVNPIGGFGGVELLRSFGDVPAKPGFAYALPDFSFHQATRLYS